MLDQLRSIISDRLPALGEQVKAMFDEQLSSGVLAAGFPGQLAEQALGMVAGALPGPLGEQLKAFLGDDKKKSVALTAGGLLALVAGQKLSALALVGKGLAGLEKVWREAHPEFEGGFAERWQKALDFYEKTHQDPMNRKLHTVGIPFIVAGSAGLLMFPAFRPLWGASAAAFAGGWALNFIGHGFFEKGAPAFADDPLSFIAGPVWDFQQIFGRGRAEVEETAAASAGGGNGHSKPSA